MLGEVENAVAAAGGWERVEGIAVGLGPGSFTGLRVGIASALALGASRGLPVRGAGTLDALAIGLAPRAGPEQDRLAILDARRGEAFASLHSPSGERVWGPWVGTPGQLGDRLAERSGTVLAAGSGAVRFRDELEDRGAEVPDDRDAVHRISAANVCRVAAGSEAAQPGEPLAPVYLRPPDAERWRERDDAQSGD